MTAYIIRGTWPSYDVFVNGEDINHATDLVSLFSWFARVAFQPGDSIHWEDNGNES